MTPTEFCQDYSDAVFPLPPSTAQESSPTKLEQLPSPAPTPSSTSSETVCYPRQSCHPPDRYSYITLVWTSFLVKEERSESSLNV